MMENFHTTRDLVFNGSLNCKVCGTLDSSKNNNGVCMGCCKSVYWTCPLCFNHIKYRSAFSHARVTHRLQTTRNSSKRPRVTKSSSADSVELNGSEPEVQTLRDGESDEEFLLSDLSPPPKASPSSDKPDDVNQHLLERVNALIDISKHYIKEVDSLTAENASLKLELESMMKGYLVTDQRKRKLDELLGYTLKTLELFTKG